MAEQQPSRPQTLRDVLAKVHLRLIVFAVVLASVSLMLSGVMVMRGYAQRNLALIANSIAYSVEPAIAFQDKQAIAESARQVGAVPGVQSFEVMDPQGGILASWAATQGRWPAALTDAANWAIWPRPTVVPVYHGETLVARIRIAGNSSEMLRYLWEALVIALACIGLAVLATRILAQRLRSEVIEPLETLAQVAHSVRTERAFEKRVPSSGIAEVDRFGQDFNALLAELQGWHLGLTSENAELQRRVSHDGLTGLGNREHFDEALSKAIAWYERSGVPFAMLFFDVDRFKEVNDEHGHVSGDAMLIAVGERLRGAIREVDSAFRLGGDEFAVILAPQPGRVHVDIVVSRIRKAMIEPIRLPSGLWQIASLSVGMAFYPTDGASAEELVHRADQAMYINKRKRRDNKSRGGASNDV